MQRKSVKIFFRVFLALIVLTFFFPLPMHRSSFSSYGLELAFASEPASENPTSESFQLVPCGTENYKVGDTLPDRKSIGDIKNPCEFSDFIKLIKRLTDYMIILGAAITAMAFAYAGFLMMSASGDEGKITKAKEIFKKVVIGFLFMLSAWVIVHTIESWLVTDTNNYKSFLRPPPTNN